MPKISRNACAVWDYTIPEDAMSKADIVAFCRQHAKKWCFQLEQGAETGYKHFQLRLSLSVRTRTPPMPTTRCHVTPTSSACKGDVFYVTKQDTRIDGPWSDETTPDVPPEYLDFVPRPWQQSVLDMESDRRVINCIVDPVGNIGKSYLCMYLGANRRATILDYSDSPKDLLRAAYARPSRMYVFDCPRAIGKFHLNGVFAALETIKNGRTVDDRYTSRERYQSPPAVWVFINFTPNVGLLSADRWRFWSVVDNQLVAFSGAAL